MKRRGLLLLPPALAVAESPGFRATSLAKASFTQESLKGKVALIQFWATWCGFCRKDQEPLDEIYMDLAGRGFEVLAVNMREPEQKVRAYLRKSSRVVPVVLSAETDLVERLRAPGFPAYFVFNKEGKLAAKAIGAQGREGLLRLLAQAGLS